MDYNNEDTLEWLKLETDDGLDVSDSKREDFKNDILLFLQVGHEGGMLYEKQENRIE